jgi:hypothetical protein
MGHVSGEGMYLQSDVHHFMLAILDMNYNAQQVKFIEKVKSFELN